MDLKRHLPIARATNDTIYFAHDHHHEVLGRLKARLADLGDLEQAGMVTELIVSGRGTKDVYGGVAELPWNYLGKRTTICIC